MRQSIEARRGEVNYRKVLYEGSINEELMCVIRERMERTWGRMSSLIRQVEIPWYLEVGGERGQRSLVMENDLGIDGIVLDISFESLKYAKDISGKFSKPKLPLRICGDINNPPFKTGSVPFIFCSEFLHHFPSPAPIIEEIYGLLAPGGSFYFDEEPFKKIAHVTLYDGEMEGSERYRNRPWIKRVLDFFFSRERCIEEQYGIIENFDTPLSLWKGALSIFPNRRVNIRSRETDSDLFNPSFKYLFHWLYGGSISGTCRKEGTLGSNWDHLPNEKALTCPTCKEGGKEPSMNQFDGSYMCTACHCSYPIIDGIAFLLPYETFRKLYPKEFSDKAGIVATSS